MKPVLSILSLAVPPLSRCPTCDATALVAASLIVGTASQVAQYQGQQQQARQQYRYAKAAAEEGQAAAKQNFQIANAQESERQREEAEASSQQISQIRKQAAEARSTARVAAGEAGVSGLSVDALLADFDRQEATSVNAVNRNRELSLRQSGFTRLGIRANGMNELSSTRFKPIARPSLTELGLGVASEGLSSYNRYRTDK
jgi:hypothetical protein